MDPIGVSYSLIFLIALICLSAFFSASEAALLSTNKIRIDGLPEETIRNAKKLKKLLDNPDKILTTILVMNNLVNILISALTTVLMYNLAGNAGVGIAAGITTIVILSFGEITPKALAIRNSEGFSLKFAGILYFLVIALEPVVFILSRVPTMMLKLSKITDIEQNSITPLELKHIINISEESGILNGTEKEIINNVFNFGDSKAKDIMTPRVNIVALDISSSYDNVLSIIKSEKYSRVPVYNETLDTIVGILNVKDLLVSNVDKKNFALKDYIREFHQTFEFRKLDDLFKEMKKDKSHITIVLDEYGSTSGIITMEDLIEEILGDIYDEFDTSEDKYILEINSREYLVNGAARLDDINEKLNINLLSEECDSIGGFFIKTINKFPQYKEKIIINDTTITIEELDKKSIKKLKITLDT